MTENQRLRMVMDRLHFKSQSAFAKKLDIQPGSLSDVLRAKNGVGVSRALKVKLAARLNVNPEWITHGIGDPFLAGFAAAEQAGGVPFYNISEEDQFIVQETTPEYFVNYKPFNDCYAYIPVYGDSMYPKYASGEVIAIKEVINREVLQWGEAYVIITDATTNGLRAIKLLHEHPDKTKLILRSSNPNFKGDTIIQRKNIVALYIIKGKITRTLI